VGAANVGQLRDALRLVPIVHDSRPIILRCAEGRHDRESRS
jgi:hypothetical protein